MHFLLFEVTSVIYILLLVISRLPHFQQKNWKNITLYMKNYLWSEIAEK